MMNHKKIISLILVVVVLALAATPALAWDDVGTDDFRATRCVVTPGMSPDSCIGAHAGNGHGSPDYPYSLLRAQ